ncbi:MULTISPECIES: universal stress protein [unclassified Rhizobium]|uniref:universal stress protein n=1 Tax=unclassified Rhizobium TaxID=2613769 RepID=UPI0006472B5C|nr:MULTISPECIES: universal stress protein [unclassified Rhizobium]OJY79604.1 MAG: universal stress protein UspA [Rhizobium sp. 60-20]RKD35550.1 universal stress protein family protein [Rhizobium sp. WW_1]
MKPQFHVPLITYPDTSSLSLVQNAVDFARHQKADLTASIMQIGMPLAGQTSPWIDDIERLNSEAKRFSQDGYVALSEALYEYAREADIRALIQTFEVSEPLVPARFTEISRAYDLSIMEVSETTIPLVERLVFDSGRPLALFPANHVCNRIDTVAIAWDGSAPLSAALTGARLFLESASKIILISITETDPTNGKALDRYAGVLRNSGLNVEVVVARANGERVAVAIQSTARALHADLLVAGAYGHSRIREYVLGGVTRSLLTELEMPILVAH